MTKTTAAKPQTKFPSGPVPWAWNETPPGGVPARDRCNAVSTEQERAKAAELVEEYRRQEGISEENNIDGLSEALGKLAAVSTKAGGLEGELIRRRIRAADPDLYNKAQARLEELRKEALELVTPMLRRVLVSYSESLAEAAMEAEHRLEIDGLPIRNDAAITINNPGANVFILWEDSVLRALWSCKVKIERTLAGIEPNNAIGATQFFLTSEERTPFSW